MSFPLFAIACLLCSASESSRGSFMFRFPTHVSSALTFSSFCGCFFPSFPFSHSCDSSRGCLFYFSYFFLLCPYLSIAFPLYFLFFVHLFLLLTHPKPVFFISYFDPTWFAVANDVWEKETLKRNSKGIGAQWGSQGRGGKSKKLFKRQPSDKLFCTVCVLFRALDSSQGSILHVFPSFSCSVLMFWLSFCCFSISFIFVPLFTPSKAAFFNNFLTYPMPVLFDFSVS